MKVVVAAAALEERVMMPGSMLFGENGRMTIANTTIHDHEKLGWMTFAQMIQKSSNLGAAKTGMLVGDQRLYRYLQAFGFGQRTDIDLPGEVSGLLKSPREWGRRSLASISMGQEVGVTPLQMITAVSAIANDGVLMKPYVVAEVRDQKGQRMKEIFPQVKRRVVSPATARTLTTTGLPWSPAARERKRPSRGFALRGRPARPKSRSTHRNLLLALSIGPSSASCRRMLRICDHRGRR
jgi:cell division protein FtsI (penicillin-binding protein 3)